MQAKGKIIEYKPLPSNCPISGLFFSAHSNYFHGAQLKLSTLSHVKSIDGNSFVCRHEFTIMTDIHQIFVIFYSSRAFR
jgi:hypothetical protein